jgi:hypothetical protein
MTDRARLNQAWRINAAINKTLEAVRHRSVERLKVLQEIRSIMENGTLSDEAKVAATIRILDSRKGLS